MAWDNSFVPVPYSVFTAAQAQQMVDNDEWLHMMVTGGISNPGTPSTNDIYYRTDLGLWIYYDGTRWLTEDEYSVDIPPLYNASSADSTIAVIRTDHAPFFTRVVFNSYVATTNNATHYWTFGLASANMSRAGGANIKTFTTSADAPNVTVGHEAAPATNNPANYGILYTFLAKTNSPGACLLACSAYYRKIIT
jgi:hypothetical protein